MNPADLMTNNLSVANLLLHVQTLSMQFQEGRAEKAAQLHAVSGNSRDSSNGSVSRSSSDVRQQRRASASEAVSAVCAEFEGSVGNDKWVERGESGRWTRLHTAGRGEMFTPYGIEHGPSRKTKLVAARKTTGVTVSGRHFEMFDDWTRPESAHAHSEEPWTGKTTFYVNTSRPGAGRGEAGGER